MRTFDYIIVGSGCAGSMAAQTLAEAGVQVAILDVGFSNPTYETAVPEQDFATLRQTDPEQYRYLIGSGAEGVAVGEVSKGAQVTPTRSHMIMGTETYIPFTSSTFSPLESLGYGGLGIGWGLQCWELSAADIKRTGLPVKRTTDAYEIVSKRIGVSGTDDQAARYTIGKLKSYQPSPKMDRNHQLLYNNYLRHQDHFISQGFYVGRTPLALLTQKLGNRMPYSYHDMDFYADHGHSSWRPWMTVDMLRKQSKITYIGDTLVLRFTEKNNTVTVHCLDIKTNKPTAFQCKKLLLASSALGSARVVLRSLGKSGARLPLLSNPHAYIPYVQPALLGKGIEDKKLGMGELSYFIDKDGTDTGLSVASSYGYQSLMLFRIIGQAPIDFVNARHLMRYLAPGFVIMITQHPDSHSPDKYLKLVDDPASPSGDKLFAHYALRADEEKLWDKREKQYIAAMRKLHAYAIRRVKTEHGSAIHYAGTVPFSQTDEPLTLSPTGLLHGTRNVYVADSSGFNYLPAKGLTFTLMANAHITAENALRS